MENIQLSLFNAHRNILWKYDGELGIAYFCPNCKGFVCGEKVCRCGQELDYTYTTGYTGKVQWE